MNIIVPMAGAGKRMRPHTLTTAKPLIPVAGKPIVERLVEDLAAMCTEKLETIAFIVGDFGEAVEKQLLEVAARLGAQGKICYQEEPLGTAHAILCAKEDLKGNVIVAFADTLFYADFKINPADEGMIYVQQVADPSAFGVVKLDSDGVITDFIEKPKEFVSDLAIIGIYYFKDGLRLRKELEYLIDNDIKEKGEYQLTNALENMKQQGLKFRAGQVIEWLDCGNKDATVHTNQRVLARIGHSVSSAAIIKNSTIVEPCFIGEGVHIENSVVGPYAAVGANAHISNAVVSNSIVQTHARIENAVLSNSMIGNYASYKSHAADLSLSDYTTASH
jgi:glucose-1-phosphate thymidylyltransferase